MSKMGKSTEKENRLVAVGGWERREGAVRAKRFCFLEGGEENVLKLKCGDVCTTA